MQSRIPLVSLLVIAVAWGACGSKGSEHAQGGNSEATSAPSATPEPANERELVVFAAASLRDVFGKLGKEFERAHPGVRVIFNFAGSQELRTQIEHGAEGDVFAAANQKHISELVDQKLVGTPVLFAWNHLVVIVPRGEGTVKSFADLPRATRIVIAAPDVPAGSYALQVLDKATAAMPEFRQQVEAHVVSRELNVRQVVAKVVLGEGNAGIVYRTDAASVAGKVDVIAIPDRLNVSAGYPIATLARPQHPALAAAWMEYVRSPEGQEELGSFGFATQPPAPGAPPSAP